jgi:hypothetical protein
MRDKIKISKLGKGFLEINGTTINPDASDIYIEVIRNNKSFFVNLTPKEVELLREFINQENLS